MDAADPSRLLNDLVDTHWETAARHAYRQYQERGRGAIVFPVASDANGSGRTPLRYLTFTDDQMAKNGAFDRLYRFVRSYNPECEVVAAAVLPDERTVFDVYERSPAPPEA